MADGVVEGSLMSDTSMPHSFAAIISVTYIITWIERDNTERGNKRDRTGKTLRDNCLLLRMHNSENTVMGAGYSLYDPCLHLEDNLSSLGEKRERAVRRTNRGTNTKKILMSPSLY